MNVLINNRYKIDGIALERVKIGGLNLLHRTLVHANKLNPDKIFIHSEDRVSTKKLLNGIVDNLTDKVIVLESSSDIDKDIGHIFQINELLYSKPLFDINEKSYSFLINNMVPIDVISKYLNIQSEGVMGKCSFRNKLVDKLGNKLFSKYSSLLLQTSYCSSIDKRFIIKMKSDIATASARLYDSIEHPHFPLDLYPKTFLAIFYSPLGRLLVPSLVKINMSPNFITTLGILLALVAAILYAIGDYKSVLIAAVIMQLSIILDSSDGRLSRLTEKYSNFGKWFDEVADQIKINILYIGIAIGLQNGYGVVGLYIGFLLLFGSICSTIVYYADLSTHVPKYLQLNSKIKKDEQSLITTPSAAKINRGFLIGIIKKINIFLGYYENRIALISIGTIFGQLLVTSLLLALYFNLLWLRIIFTSKKKYT